MSAISLPGAILCLLLGFLLVKILKKLFGLLFVIVGAVIIYQVLSGCFPGLF